MILGTVLFGLGFAWLDRLGADATYTALWLSMAVIGAGLGFTMVTMLLAVQNSVPRRLIATGTSATIFFRTIGGTIGVAIMGAVLTHHLTEASRSTSDPALIELASRPDSIVQDTSRARLSSEALEWLRHALSDGLESAFLVGVVIAVVAFLASLSFPGGSARELAERREGVSPGL
jgi:hypothetical protein